MIASDKMVGLRKSLAYARSLRVNCSVAADSIAYSRNQKNQVLIPSKFPGEGRMEKPKGGIKNEINPPPPAKHS
jgi:hypothetical protein